VDAIQVALTLQTRTNPNNPNNPEPLMRTFTTTVGIRR
jgi:hypothetical protein